MSMVRQLQGLEQRFSRYRQKEIEEVRTKVSISHLDKKKLGSLQLGHSA